MKTTLATIKSFIKREAKAGNLFIKCKSSFDGMIDCVRTIEGDWKKVEKIDIEQTNSFGIQGVWWVGSSRDLFTPYADDTYIGWEIYNCCGSSIVAMKK